MSVLLCSVTLSAEERFACSAACSVILGMELEVCGVCGLHAAQQVLCLASRVLGEDDMKMSSGKCFIISALGTFWRIVLSNHGLSWGFPRGSDGKDLWVGTIPWRRE